MLAGPERLLVRSLGTDDALRRQIPGEALVSGLEHLQIGVAL